MSSQPAPGNLAACYELKMNFHQLGILMEKLKYTVIDRERETRLYFRVLAKLSGGSCAMPISTEVGYSLCYRQKKDPL
jgi:hypothetical protein